MPVGFSMKYPILYSALLGWASVPVVMLAAVSLPGAPPTGGDLGLQFLVVTAYSGVIALPACLLAGALVNGHLPPSSPWWQPKYAAIGGGLCGIVVMHLIFNFMSGHFVLWAGSIIAAVPGAICGFSLATFKRKLPNKETPTPHP